MRLVSGLGGEGGKWARAFIVVFTGRNGGGCGAGEQG